jgi:MinD-like ATPase involved in chromosome partitioning or flagellar assembly
MAVFLLRGEETPVAAFESTLRAKIPHVIEVTSLDAIVKYKARDKSSAPAIGIVFLPEKDNGYFSQLTDFARRNSEKIFLVLVGNEISASDYKLLIQTAGADWVSSLAAPNELLDIISRRQLAEDDDYFTPSRSKRRHPVTVSFVPSAGGVGNTTIAVETAVHLKNDKNTRERKICIIDLDFQTSHLCDHLDSEPRLHIAELNGAPDRLDDQLFESFRTRHSSGIDVFAAPRSKFLFEELDINALDALLDVIATRYDLIFIDCPVPWFPWSPHIVAASDGVIITGINTIPCLRQVSETLGVVRSHGAANLQIAVAINRCEHNLFGSIARRQHVVTALRNERLYFISDWPNAVESVNMGVPMLLGGSPAKLRREFGQLAEFCAGLRSSRVVLT